MVVPVSTCQLCIEWFGICFAYSYGTWSIWFADFPIETSILVVPHCGCNPDRSGKYPNCCWLISYPYGYGSIPINTIFNGMNIHLPAILTHCHILSSHDPAKCPPLTSRIAYFRTPCSRPDDEVVPTQASWAPWLAGAVEIWTTQHVDGPWD